MEIDPNLIMAILVIAGSVLPPLLERWRRRKLREAGQEPEGPEPAEPKLPYEDVVDEIFGPYMERRRREWVAVQAASPEPASPQSPEEPVVRIVQERPAAPLVVKAAPAEAVQVSPAPSLEDRLFRRLSPGARLVIAAELMGRPRFTRR